MPEPLHLAIVMTNAEQRGGSERLLQYLIRRAGDDWQLSLAFLEEGPMVEEARRHGHSVVVIPAPRIRDVLGTVRCILRLRSWLKERKPRLVLGWMKKAHIYSGIAARGIAPVAWFQHENPGDGSIDALIHRIPAVGIPCCSDMVRDAQRKATPGTPCSTVHPCQDVQSEPPAEIDWPVPAGAKTLVMVCRLQAWKGPHLVVQALGMLRKRCGQDIHLLVVGGKHDLEADYPDFLNAEITRLGLGSVVHLVGFQKGPATWMRHGAVVVHASHGEPFGMVVAEAIALGVPVVAASPGGPDEIVRPGVDGFLWNYPDVESLASNLEKALAMPHRAPDPERFGISAYLSDLRRAVLGFLGGKD